MTKWRNNWSRMTSACFNLIGNQRKHWCQLHGIGCNWWTSTIGRLTNLEWHYICLSIQLGTKERNSINWVLSRIGHNGWTSSIGGKINLEWHYIFIWNAINWLEIWRITCSTSIKLQIKEYIDINWILIQNLNRTHWKV